MKEFISAVVLLPLLCSAQNGPVIETTYGTIRGFVDTTEAGATYEAYFGVPYATPPLENLRFAKPIPPEPWEGILETTEFPNGCIEVFNNTDTSEDCLYLNAYVPGRNRSGDGLAVMVWAHGGAFFFGTGSFYPGQDLATHGDVIIVTVNYRLGALGFLSTEDEASPGNYGLWDVKLALEWVRDNIAAFGGSPDRVTVFGQSAGGAITSHMMISPETQDLLARGICISGTSSAYFGTAIPGAAASSSELLGRRLGCPDTNNSQALVECLRQEDPYDINFWGLGSVIIFKQQLPNLIPVIDGEFIPQHPAITWNDSTPTGLDLITGAVIDDAAAFILINAPGNLNFTFNLAETKVRLDLTLRVVTRPYPGNYRDMKAAMIDQYPGIDDNDTVTRTQALSELLTDFLFDTGPHFEASHHSLVSGSTYLYEYAYPNSFLRDSIDEEHQWMIADHSDDLYMIWGEEFSSAYEFSEEDKALSLQMMSYYTNFANTGDPNEGLDVAVSWPQYTRENREYLQFSEETQVVMQTDEELDNYRFWVREFPEVAFP